MSAGSSTCITRWVCIRPDEECRFTSLCSHADVEPKRKCYCVSPSVWVHRPPPHHPHAFWPSTYPTTPPPFLPCCSLLLHPFPPISGRSCSIPAGPCLFISSEMAMINETLNTSSLSPGPGVLHSWVNKPSRCSTMRPQPLVWGGPTGNSLKQVATHKICQICVVLSFKIYVYEDIQTKVNLSIDGWKTKQCVLLTLSLPEHVWQTFIHVGSLWSSSSWETSFSLEKAHAVAADLLSS